MLTISQIAEESSQESVVLTPSKLSVFYKKFAVKDEPHPYSGNISDSLSPCSPDNTDTGETEIFECHEDDKEDYKDIAVLYEDVECEYHLVKPHPSSRTRPLVPALTAAGFVKWIIMAIYAYPDEEAARLHAIISRLPIDADNDGRRERLPKQLSRYLLPARPDKSARRCLDRAVEEVLFERGAREKRERRASYGSGGIRARPTNRRSESEPVGRSTSRRGSADDDEAPKKHVSFGRPRLDASAPASRRPSAERAGRPYNLNGGKMAMPASSERHDDPPSPSSPHFELNSGRDRDREYRYSAAAAPRRLSGGEERSHRSERSERSQRGDRDDRVGSRRHKSSKPEVVVKQERAPSWRKILSNALGDLDERGILDM